MLIRIKIFPGINHPNNPQSEIRNPKLIPRNTLEIRCYIAQHN